jgi:LmbE family N-acetylglucosaminyl deacetylase
MTHETGIELIKTGFLSSFQKALFLNPHGDDAGVNAGGTIVNLINAGCEVRYVSFSLPKPAEQGRFRDDQIRAEIKKATEMLGIKPQNVTLLDYPIRRFHQTRQEILDELVKARNLINPDLVFCHSSYDVHQDHKVIHEETLRAFKSASILGYECHWNQILGQNNRVFVPISEDVFRRKIQALREYRSQEGRAFVSDALQSAIAQYHGMQIQQKYSEVFECIRLVSK